MTILEIILIALLMIVAISIVWTTCICGISPMPSSKKARDAILLLTEETSGGAIYELGSGWGNLLIPLAKKHPDRIIIAYELSIVPYLTSKVLITVMGLKNVFLYRRDFMAADLSGASLIICYLFSGAMTALEKKLGEELGQSEFLISHHFALPTQQPVRTLKLDDLYQTPIYLYRLNV